MTRITLLEAGSFYFTTPSPASAADYLRVFAAAPVVVTGNLTPRAWLVDVEPGAHGRPTFTVLAEIKYDPATEGPILEPV